MSPLMSKWFAYVGKENAGGTEVYKSRKIRMSRSSVV